LLTSILRVLDDSESVSATSEVTTEKTWLDIVNDGSLKSALSGGTNS